MAETITNIAAGMDSEQVIATINNNFNILKNQISTWNASFSYWDVLQVAVVFESTAEQAADRQQAFISTVWTTLENYKGAYINSESFDFQSHTLKRGDYIIKLPGEESVYIPGAADGYYYPSYTAANNSIKWEYTTTHSGAVTITIPSMTGVYTYESITPRATITVPAGAQDIHWFYSNPDRLNALEEVFWFNSIVCTSMPAQLFTALDGSNKVHVSYYRTIS